jgi:chromosome segregation ATPase
VRLKEHEAHVAALKLEVLAEEAVSRAQQALLQETVARTDSLAGAIEQCRATASATAMDAAALADASSLEEARVQSADVCGRVHAAESDVELLEQRLASARGAASAQAAKVQQAEGDADALRKSIQCVGERSQEMEQRIVMAEQLLLQLCEITAVSKSHTATVLTSSDAARVDVLREETRMAALRDAVDACRAQIGQAGQMRVARRSQVRAHARPCVVVRVMLLTHSLFALQTHSCRPKNSNGNWLT